MNENYFTVHFYRTAGVSIGNFSMPGLISADLALKSVTQTNLALKSVTQCMDGNLGDHRCFSIVNSH